MMIVSEITKWFHGYGDSKAGMQLVDRHCRDNWKTLGSFMIFYVRNVGDFHWVLDLAVNLFCMVAKITEADLDKIIRIYGFLHIHPLEGGSHNGTMLATSQFSSSSSFQIRAMVAL
jgi:hypothetical protein